MFPYLDLIGFKRRTPMAPAEVDYVETDSPGYVARRISLRSSYINSRLRKRYGQAKAGTRLVDTGNGLVSLPTIQNSLPLGQMPPVLISAGTIPPDITLSGRPTLGSIEILINITSPGGLGTAIFSWSADGGATPFHTGNLTAATFALAGTGMTANFPNAAYAADNQYAAATPVPEAVLGWLTTFVTYDVYRRRGFNPQDPAGEALMKDVEAAMAELKEAADSKDGLFDLPVSEDLDSAVTTGGPLAHVDASPYHWQTRQQRRAIHEDAHDGSVIDPEDIR